jgi:hypothetical protein
MASLYACEIGSLQISGTTSGALQLNQIQERHERASSQLLRMVFMDLNGGLQQLTEVLALHQAVDVAMDHA